MSSLICSDLPEASGSAPASREPSLIDYRDAIREPSSVQPGDFVSFPKGVPLSILADRLASFGFQSRPAYSRPEYLQQDVSDLQTILAKANRQRGPFGLLRITKTPAS